MAPKKKSGKAPSNGYFYFLMELRNKMDHNQADKEASRMWPIMSLADKEPYNMRARRTNCSNVKMTTLLENIDHISKADDEQKQKEQNMQDDIKSHIRFLTDSKSINDEYFHIMHVNNFFVTTDNVYYPAEIALVRFNFEQGVKEENVYHSMIKPGQFPVGYMGTAKTASEDTHKVSYLATKPCNMKEIIRDVFDFLTDSASVCSDPNKLPPIYVKDDFRSLVNNVLYQMADEYGYDPDQLRVYSLSFLLYTIRNDIRNTNVWPSISQSINELDRDVYDYTREIPCKFHLETDSPIHCSRSHAVRMAFILCDNCCGDLGIRVIPGQHVPLDSNINDTVSSSYAPSEGSSYRTPAQSYAHSQYSYQTNINTLEFDDKCTLTTDDTDQDWTEVRSQRTQSSAPSTTGTVTSNTARRPKTDWREALFKGRGKIA